MSLRNGFGFRRAALSAPVTTALLMSRGAPVPCSRPTRPVLGDGEGVTALEGYEVRVLFGNGEVRDVDIEPLLDRAVFQPQRERECFVALGVDDLATPSSGLTVRSSEGWAVTGSDTERASSLHRTQAEAVAAARRVALKSGGGEVVIHAADGQNGESKTIGAAMLDDLRRGGQGMERPPARAPRNEGAGTTLRLPDELAAVAERLARALDISCNDSLLRLAGRGARLYEQEQSIAARRVER